MTVDKVKIRFATLEDLDQIVDIHMISFKDFFLTTLGKHFLYEYYKVYIEFNHLILVLEYSDSIEGFVVGSDEPNMFYKNLKSKYYRFIIPLLKNVFNSNVILKAINRVHSVFMYNKANPKLQINDCFNELISIAVKKDGKVKKGGSMLIKKYEEICYGKGMKGIALTTDALNNDRVINFYIKNGFKETRTFKQDEKRKMLLLSKIFYR